MKRPSIKTTLLLGLCLAFGSCHRQGPVLTSSDPNARSCSHNDEYFPKGSLSWGDEQIAWETQYLQMMGESSLYRCPVAGAEPTVRFLWDRSLSRPIAVNLSIHPDGTGEVGVRMLAHGGMLPPLLLGQKEIESKVWYQRTIDQRKAVGKEQVNKVLSLLGGVVFLTDHNGPNTTDGSDWIFETEEAGRYKVVDFRNTPPEAARTLGLFMVRDLGGVPVSDREVY